MLISIIKLTINLICLTLLFPPTLVYYCVSSLAVIGTQFIELENGLKNFPKVLLDQNPVSTIFDISLITNRHFLISYILFL